MKKDSVTIGNYTINVSVEPIGETRMAIVVTCGVYKLRHIMNHRGPHDMSEKDFETTATKQIMTVAKELARKMRSTDLVKSFASPRPAPALPAAEQAPEKT